MKRAVASSVTAVVVLAACGGSPTARNGQSTASPPPTTTTTTTTTGTTASTPTGPQGTSGPGSPAGSSASAWCQARELSLSFLGGQGATGHGELGFALRNTGSRTCITLGYPGIQFLDRSGRPLPTTPSHTTQDFFGTLPKRRLTVTPGDTFSFRLGVTHGAASTAGCTTAYALQVIPPNDTVVLKVALPDGAYECGTATVSPVQPGTTAY